MPRGQRDEVWDGRVPGFGIRISDTKDADPARRGKAGKITFILRARFSSGAAPTRRTIGVYGSLTLEQARHTAGEWRSLIAKGIDPAVVEAEAREKADRERALRIKHSFAAVAEAFITDKLKHERSGDVAERDLRTTFIAAWADRPIIEITKFDVLEIINAKKRRGAPQMARALLVLQETVEGSSLLRRGENYSPQSIPDAVRMLTAGVDVQGDRLEVQILGFGAFEECWAVRYEVLPGDPAQRGVWDLLDGVLTESYRTDAGRELRVRLTCVDSGGHHQHQVLTYCRNRGRRGLLPTKGIAGPRPVWPIRASRTKNDARIFMV